MIRALPGAQFEATLEGAPSGLVGTIGVRILDNAGNTLGGRVIFGIVEDLAGSGIYSVTLTAPGPPGLYEVLWDLGGTLTPANTASEDLVVDVVALACYAVAPGVSFQASVKGATGRSMRYRIVDNIGNVVIPATTSGVTEYPAGSGVYYATIPAAPATPGQYAIVWDDGTIAPGHTASFDLTVATPSGGGGGGGGGGGTAIPDMPDTLFLCGQEVINPARALDYMRQLGLGRFFDVSLPSELPQVLYRMRGAVETFSDPATDGAPWYDSAVPASGNFLGVLIQSVSGLDSTVTRTVTAQGEGGGVLGRGVAGPRTMTWKGWLVGRGFDGIEYGKRWLVGVLNQMCNPGNPCDATLRLYAPPDDGSNDELGKRILYRVGLVSGPQYVETDNCPDVAQVTFTLVAERSEFNTDPTDCLPPALLWAANTPGGACIDFCDWLVGTGGPITACTIIPPVTGRLSSIITITAGNDGVRGVLVGTWASAADATQEPLSSIIIPVLDAGASMVIDSARRVITYIGPDGVATDGWPHINWPLDADGNFLGWDWISVDDCDPALAIGVQVGHPSGGGWDTTVEIATVSQAL